MPRVDEQQRQASCFRRRTTQDFRDSIRQHSILEPILIRKESFEIIDGERRWRAQKAEGAKKIVVRLYDVDDPTAAEIRLTAQMQRVDLSDREKEDALYELWDEGTKSKRYKSQMDMARATGISQNTLSRIILAKEERIIRADSQQIKKPHGRI